MILNCFQLQKGAEIGIGGPQLKLIIDDQFPEKAEKNVFLSICSQISFKQLKNLPQEKWSQVSQAGLELARKP